MPRRNSRERTLRAGLEEEGSIKDVKP